MAKDTKKPSKPKGPRGQMIRRVSYLWPGEDAALRKEAAEKGSLGRGGHSEGVAGLPEAVEGQSLVDEAVPPGVS